MAVRYGDDETARVLTKLKRRTPTGKRWNALQVTSIRARYKICGQRRSTPNPDVLSLAQAAQYAGVSDTTIRRLVQADLSVTRAVSRSSVPWPTVRGVFCATANPTQVVVAETDQGRGSRRHH